MTVFLIFGFGPKPSYDRKGQQRDMPRMAMDEGVSDALAQVILVV